MASNMLYCHICKAMAFAKTRLSTVATLDCGHMAKLGRDETLPGKSYSDVMPARGKPTPRSKSKVAVSPASYTAPKTTYTPPQEATPTPPPMNRVKNHRSVAHTVIDLIDGK